MHRIKVLSSALCLALAITSSVLSQTPGVKLVSNGEFKDRDGALHSWRINGGHTLLWDGRPYVPVGGVFYSKYVCLGQTEENWQSDVRALESIKSKGITDVLLKSIVPVTWSKPEAWQKLIDYLDSGGFTYGMDYSDGPKSPLTGFVIEPTRYKVGNIAQDSTFSFDMPDVTAAFWMLCSMTDGSVVASGGVRIADGKVSVKVKTRNGENSVLLLYPERELSGAGRDGVADMWGGFDEFRDRLTKFCDQIEFGKGLRFFVDPLSNKMDFPRDLASFIPDSSEFRLEFEAYLAEKYQNIGSLNAAWAFAEDQTKSFQHAARLIPLWRGSRGIPAVYDRAQGQRYQIDVPRSRIWNDIQDFRDTSAQSYLNAAADLVKRQAANVPVIYKASRYHRVYANTASRGGFDGLAVQSYGHGDDLVTGSAGSIYALAEESARSTWFVIAGTQDTPRPGKDARGYRSREEMQGDLDSLAEIGAKGIFVFGVQVLPEDTWKGYSLTDSPDQLGWLKDFKDKFVGGDRSAYAPQVVYYPADPVVGGTVSRIGKGAWWLPSLKTGTRLAVGDTIGGYTVAGQPGICMWSRTGRATITLLPQPDQKPSLVYPKDGVGILAIDKKKISLKLSETPILVTGLDPAQVIPVEVLESEIAKLGPLVARAKAAGVKVPGADTGVDRARGVMKSGRAAVAYDIAHTFVKQVQDSLGTYCWVEGEDAVSHSFDGVESSSELSMGGYLSLDTAATPPMSPYSASFNISIPKESNNEIWLAATTLASGRSPVSYSVDNAPWQTVSTPDPPATYSMDFAWTNIGSTRLAAGDHTLQIRVDGPGSGGRYKLGIDAIVFSPTPFKSDGIKKP